jgi:aryl-alcohol dehydrogenase-like predicted oxidoreductase
MTGLEVHPLCLGGNVFGWTADERASHAVLDRYVAAGGDFIDTADSYSVWVPGNAGGVSETIIGRWLSRAGSDTQRVTIATKVGQYDAAGLGDLKPETIVAACDASLRRLGIDRIGLYYQHRDDPEVPLAESLGAFDALVREGKIERIGVSNVSADRLREMVGVVAREGYAPIAAVQTQYNLLDRAGYEDELQAVCAEHGIACVAYYGLAMGFLSGKYRSESDAKVPATPRAENAMRLYGSQPRAWRTLERLRGIAADLGVPVAAAALAWLAARETVVAAVASATTVAQLDELLTMTDARLDAAQLAALDAVTALDG